MKATKNKITATAKINKVAAVKDISSYRPEIFIGLVSPAGVDLDPVCEELIGALKEVSYDSSIIRLSSILEEEEIKKIHGESIKDKPADEKINSLMSAGNSLRQKMNRKDALSLLAVSQVRNIRKVEAGIWDKPIEGKAYIFRSFKNKDEISTLKDIYGPQFFLISVYSPRDKRLRNLAKRIAKSQGKGSQYTKFLSKAEDLIERDFSEDNESFGQQVRGAFPLGDLFVEVEATRTRLHASIQRFIRTIYGYPYHTPTKHEFGMFLAFSVALRSADLSRQVGSAILNSQGELLSIGCNEVPKFGGGQYWEDDEQKKVRDFELGYDSSSLMKKEILEETITNLQEVGLIDNKDSPAEITKDLLYGKFSSKMANADITNLLEYGRMIHAEMAAISDAAKRGISLEGATLYCTTFPCHMCARHILAAGIKKVIYVEPYPKSKVGELYEDSIVVDSELDGENRLAFLPFVGISPYRFHDFFKHTKRKTEEGYIKEWLPKEAIPKVRSFNYSYIIHNETDANEVLSKIFKDLVFK